MNSTIELTFASLMHNQATFGGGLYAVSTPVTSLDTQICDNTARSGGGFFLSGSPGDFTRNQVHNNIATQGFGGGGAVVPGLPLRTIDVNIHDSNFTGNRMTETFGLGGGALAFRGSVVTIGLTMNANLNNCQFMDNRSQNGGGAIYTTAVLPTSVVNLYVNQSTFQQNYARVVGGAISAEGGFLPNGAIASVTIEASRFTENESEKDGGAIACNRTQPTEVRVSTFEDNVATDKGGAISFNSDQGDRTLTLQRNTFTRNRAGSKGGAVKANSIVGRTTFRSTGETYTNNRAQQGGGGIAIRGNCSTFFSKALLKNCTSQQQGAGGIDAQVSQTSELIVAGLLLFGADGPEGAIRYMLDGPESLDQPMAIIDSVLIAGGTHTLGAALSTRGVNTSIVNSAIFANTSSTGPTAGIWLDGGSSHEIINSTIAGNSAPAGAGGGVFVADAPLTIDNSILSHNTSSTGQPESAQIRTGVGGSVIANRTLVQNLTGSLGGTGNIAGNPLFVDIVGPDLIPWSGDEDVSIDAGSPCIDAGDNTRVPAGLTEDLGGNPRYVDDPMTPDTGVPGGSGGTNVIDMGAYEFQGQTTSCYPDCDQTTGPGVLDIFDFLCFGNHFANNDPYACNCDLSTGQNICDIFDFLCFGNAFAAGCP